MLAQLLITLLPLSMAYNYLPHMTRAIKKLSNPVKYEIPNLTEADFPLPPFPIAWYPICTVDKIKKNKKYPFKIAGEDIILFRDNSDEIRAVSTFCKHNGVDLRYGGEISDKCIVCPFHGKKMLGNLPIEVTNDFVFIWKGPMEGNKPPFTMKSMFELVGHEDLKPLPFFSRKHTMGGHPIDFAEQSFDFQHAMPIHGQNVIENKWTILENNQTYITEFGFWNNRHSRSIGVSPTVAIIEFFNESPIFAYFVINDVGKMDIVFVPAKKKDYTLKRTFKSIFSSFYIYGDTQDEAAYITTKNHHKRKLDASEFPMTNFREWYRETFY